MLHPLGPQVEIGRAVDGGDRIRLGDDQQISGARELAHLTLQHDRALLAVAARAHEPEPGLWERLQQVAGAAAAQPVLPIAEEGEVPFFHPFEQRLHLARLARLRSAQPLAQIRGNLARHVAHCMPVGRRAADIIERALDAPLQRHQPCRVGFAIDLDVLPGLRPGIRNASSGNRSVRRPWRSRMTPKTGCAIRWIASLSCVQTMPSESTRNGMSSVTTATTV